MTGVHVKRRLTQNGKPRYLVYYRRGGRGFKTIYAGSFPNKESARIRRDVIAGELAAGRDPAVWLKATKTPAISAAPPPTLEGQWEAFSASRIDVSESSIDSFRNARIWWVRILGAGTDPATIQPRDIIDGIGELAETLAPNSVRQYVTVLRQVLDYCDVEPNPARSRKVKLPRVGESKIEIPDTKTWFAIRDKAKTRSRPALRLIEADALRVSEAASLTCGNIDFVDSRILIADAKTAAGRRWLPVPRPILDEIEDLLPEPSDRPATMLAFGLNAQNIRYDLERACLTAAVGSYSPHELRHRRISLWYRHGIDPITTKGWAGHTKASMGLDTYGHTVLDPREDEWREFWLGQVREAPVRHGGDVL